MQADVEEPDCNTKIEQSSKCIVSTKREDKYIPSAKDCSSGSKEWH
jgi:hypothetical protein